MSISICIAPRNEQDAIISYITEHTSPIRSVVERTMREIQLLQEYRTRLISDVVTGKLDVREAAKNLPMEIITEPSDNMSDGENEEEIEEAA